MSTGRLAAPDERGVANLVYELADAIDEADGARIETTFGDATFVLGDNPPRAGGAAFRAIVEQGMIRYDGSPRTKHVITNLVVTIDGAGGGGSGGDGVGDCDGRGDDAVDGEVGVTATASSLVTVFQAVPPELPLQAVLGGRYEDRFRWTGDGWAWVERRMAITHRGDTSKHSVHRL